jgi:hypothetical protein
MNWQNYGLDFEGSRFWRIVTDGIQAWRSCVDLYAIDCIRMKSTQRMLGLWSPYKDRAVLHEIITERLDNYPAWAKYKENQALQRELENAVREQLARIAHRYRRIIAFLNVRAYHECISRLSNEYEIIALPRKVDWRAARAVPCRNLGELREALSTVTAELLPVQLAS